MSHIVTRRAALVAAGVVTGAGCVAAKAADPYSIVFPPGGDPFGNLFALSYLGPPSGTVVSARLEMTFTTIGSFDAADLNIGLATPVIDPDGFSTFYFVTGADLGWTGQGTFEAAFDIPELLGEIAMSTGIFTRWQLDISGPFELDPPLFFGSFGEGSGFHFQIEPVPAPSATAALALAAGALAARRRRPA